MKLNPLTQPGPFALLVASITLTTPSGDIDYPATINHIAGLARRKVRGVVVTGTTGKGQLLPLNQKIQLHTAVADARSGGILPSDFILIAGTGTSSIDEALLISNYARDKGYEGILALPPGGGRCPIRFYGDLAQNLEESSTVLFGYKHPRLSPDYVITPEQLAELMKQYPAMAGVKDSSPDPHSLFSWGKGREGENPPAICGEDKFVFSSMHDLRCRFTIAGSGNTLAGLGYLQTLIKAANSGNWTDAYQTQLFLNEYIDALLAEVAMGKKFHELMERDRIPLK